MQSLFLSARKVHKDRQVMRDADHELARRSIRGATLHLILYVLVLMLGDFYQQAPKWAVGLGVGLALSTVLRCFFLYRFEVLYGRGPGRWRNRFLFSSLLTGAWWSGILVAHLWYSGLVVSTFLLWFYTIVMGASTCMVQAPFSPFYRWMVGTVCLPTAITALFLQTPEGYALSAMWFGFYMFLLEVGKEVEERYWQQLEGHLALRKSRMELQRAQRKTDTGSHLKNEFLSNMSHEFRTPLNDALGAMSMLADTSMKKDQREWLKVSEMSCESLLSMVNNILELSKISSQSILLDSVVFNLRRTIELVVEEHISKAHDRSAEINYVFDPDMPQRVRGDPERLRQIVTNLVANAIRFSERGEILVRVKMDPGERSYGRLRVEVEDQGVGIGDEDHQRIFEVFSRADDRQAKNLGGAGLGLAICKGLVANMGGEIGFDSKPGQGTCFWFTVDLLVAGGQHQPFRPHSRLKGKRCLVANWPPKAAEAVLVELDRWGIDATSVKGVAPIIEQLRHGETSDAGYDLLLLNMGLGEDDRALEVSRIIAEDSQLGGVRQVLVASLEQRGTQEFYRHVAQFNQCLSIAKPARRIKLHEAIVQLLAGGVRRQNGDSVVGVDVSELNEQSVLLVEDHKVNQMITRGMLTKLGYSVKVVENGQEALGAMGEHKFDLILMDCQMPVMDGYEAAKEIREREAGTTLHVPIIAMTAHAAEEDEERCLSVGMDDYLAKPVKLEELRARLAHWGQVGLPKAG